MIESLNNANFRVTPELITVLGNPNATHWNVDDGYDSNVDQSLVHPYRVFGTGQRFSLFAAVHQISENDGYRYCTEAARGFSITIHSPNEIPRPSDD